MHHLYFQLALFLASPLHHQKITERERVMAAQQVVVVLITIKVQAERLIIKTVTDKVTILRLTPERDRPHQRLSHLLPTILTNRKHHFLQRITFYQKHSQKQSSRQKRILKDRHLDKQAPIIVYDLFHKRGIRQW